MNTCSTCKHWTQGHDRYVVNGKVRTPAHGHCDIHDCMCIKTEDQDCCHGFHDWEGPVEREIRVDNVSQDVRSVVMPWQPGYSKWAKMNPDLAKTLEENK